MKIHELFEDGNLPSDGKGNLVVWDPQRRAEVLVPEKEVARLIAKKQLVGGALNIGSPSHYPNAPSQHNYNSSNPNTPTNKPTSFLGHVKKGYQDTSKKIQDFPYTKTGRAIGGISRFVQDISKGPRR